MAVYRFKISFEDYDDVFRIIELRSSHTFKDFNDAIQKAIGFDNTKESSFFISDDYWRKGIEITLSDNVNDADFDSKRKPKRLMHKSKMADFIEDPHQKLIYLFDFDAQWTFNIELVKILLSEDVTASYPRCINSGGTAPKQYKPVTNPLVIEDEEDEDPVDVVENIFHHEEGLDDGDEDEDGKLIDGENDEEAEEGTTAGEESADEM